MNNIKIKDKESWSEYLPKLRTYLLKINRILLQESHLLDVKLILVCLNLNEDILTYLKLFKRKGIDVDNLIKTSNSIEIQIRELKE